jgi:tetratricopeptide (TPR) repeat protein
LSIPGTNRPHVCRLICRYGLFLSVLFLISCTSISIQNPPSVPDLVNQPKYDIPDIELLAITPDMKVFVDLHTYGDNLRQGSAWSLAYAAMDPNIFNFDYDPLVTLSADQTFEKRVGNCLSFSSMFIAMAREAGMDAYFQEVEIPPTWSAVENNLLVGKHVNAVIYKNNRTITVDVSRRKGREIERTRRISDTEALAQYYNNLGADALIAQDIALAYAYFRKGLKIDNRLDYIWSNAGVILRRNGQTQDAVLAYRVALELDPDQAAALNNLHLIYTEDGDLEAAEEFSLRVERNRRKNPYYVQHVAETAIEEHRYRDAIETAKKAIRMDPDEYRFYYTLAQAQYQAGKISVAQASLDQARKRAPEGNNRNELVLPGEGY